MNWLFLSIMLMALAASCDRHNEKEKDTIDSVAVEKTAMIGPAPDHFLFDHYQTITEIINNSYVYKHIYSGGYPGFSGVRMNPYCFLSGRFEGFYANRNKSTVYIWSRLKNDILTAYLSSG
ncbi:hypothetical protein AB9P05_01470 [Roseivirga sp. BDSF3-8]|uniref:hypothetical protein n=1 Tax=Roseivirga sp. BDSF3-8 TaxID=3241598 RepID=UPI0035324568